MQQTPDLASAAAAPSDTITGAVWGAMRRAPRYARAYIIIAPLYVASMTLWIVFSTPNAWRRAPMYAALFGGGAGILLGVTGCLFNVAQGEKWTHRVRWGLKGPRRMTDMLLALPVLAFVAGVLGTAATVVMVPPAWKEPVLLLPVAATLWAVIMSAKVTADATRWLYFHAREQAQAAESARAEAAGAQLAALQAQMNPHFLFNALNTIASLVRTDARAAEATTENLAHVLRRTLDRTRRTECTVEDELDYLRAYLSVERERFGERLKVDFDIDPSALRQQIPTMTLQPLVENSLKYGVAGRLGGGRVAVSARRGDGRLRLEVADDGPGFPREPREGTGLGNLRRRLETIYHGAAELRVDRPGSGARVVVELPAAEG